MNRNILKSISIRKTIIMILLSFGFISTVFASEGVCQLVAESYLTMPHNSTLTTKYRKFGRYQQMLLFHWTHIEEGPKTPGIAQMHVSIQKKGLFSGKTIKTKTIKESVSETNSDLTFDVGSGNYRFFYDTQEGGWNVSLGSFESDEVQLWTNDV